MDLSDRQCIAWIQGIGGCWNGKRRSPTSRRATGRQCNNRSIGSRSAHRLLNSIQSHDRCVYETERMAMHSSRQLSPRGEPLRFADAIERFQIYRNQKATLAFYRIAFCRRERAPASFVNALSGDLQGRRDFSDRGLLRFADFDAAKAHEPAFRTRLGDAFGDMLEPTFERSRVLGRLGVQH